MGIHLGGQSAGKGACQLWAYIEEHRKSYVAIVNRLILELSRSTWVSSRWWMCHSS